MPAIGGAARQLTYHTAGYDQVDWAPDGKRLLAHASRDAFWRHPERFFLLDCRERPAELLLFDDYGSDGQLSPDGKKLLFTREGGAWWRKGYTGSHAAQVWLYDLEAKEFSKVLSKNFGCRWPLWRPDGNAFYYVEEHAQGANLFEYHFPTRQSRQLTSFKEDSVVFPCVARDGSAVVFRHLFDLYRFGTSPPQRRSPRKKERAAAPLLGDRRRLHQGRVRDRVRRGRRSLGHGH
jgi:tricorn protease